MKIYKLTDEDGRDHDGRIWTAGARFVVGGSAYRSVVDATAFGPNFDYWMRPRLWIVRPARVSGNGLRLQCEGAAVDGEDPDFRPLRPAKHAALALRCATRVFAETEFYDWAQGWIHGIDRSAERARVAVRHLENDWPSIHELLTPQWSAATHAANAALAVSEGGHGRPAVALAAASLVSASFAAGDALDLRGQMAIVEQVFTNEEEGI